MLEFKFAKTSAEVENMKSEGKTQLEAREYTKGYVAEGRRIISAVLVADDENRQIVAFELRYA